MHSLSVKSEHCQHANVPVPEACKPHEAGLENEPTRGALQSVEKYENRGNKAKEYWKTKDLSF